MAREDSWTEIDKKEKPHKLKCIIFLFFYTMQTTILWDDDNRFHWIHLNMQKIYPVDIIWDIYKMENNVLKIWS